MMVGLFRQSRLPTQPYHVAVGFPRVDLPGVDDLFPLRQQEMWPKLNALHLGGRIREQLLDDFARG